MDFGLKGVGNAMKIGVKSKMFVKEMMEETSVLSLDGGSPDYFPVGLPT